MLFKDLMPNCTFGHLGQLCVKLPRPISVAYGRRSKEALPCNALLLHPEGANLLCVSDREEVTADTLANHPEVEKVLCMAQHTGVRLHLRLVAPVLVENCDLANAVLLGAPVAFISVH